MAEVISREDRGPVILAVYWTFSILAILVTLSRLLSRRLIKAVGWDDWTMVLTTASQEVICLHVPALTVNAAPLSDSNDRIDSHSTGWSIQAHTFLIGIPIKKHFASNCRSACLYGSRPV